jgi:hypothetical protein
VIGSLKGVGALRGDRVWAIDRCNPDTDGLGRLLLDLARVRVRVREPNQES